MEKQSPPEKRTLYLAALDHREMCIGVLCITVSFLMPLLFNVRNFSVLRSMGKALRNSEKLDLMAAALQLVALNSLRGIPHYVGAFFVADALEFRWRGHKALPVNALLILVILLLTYQGIGAIHDVHYDFGLPAMLLSSFVLMFRKINYQYVSLVKKAGLIALVLTALQFLDVMPVMSRFPVGRGEMSMDIKMSSSVLGADTILNTMALVGMTLFLSFALVVLLLLRDENNLRELSVLKEQNQAILVQSQLNEMKNRTYQEMQYLVHDLKSPLTAAQTLVGVLKLECQEEQRERDVEYLDHIENAVERMSDMISEILYEDQMSPIPTEKLVGVVLAQSSVNDYAAYLHVDNQAPQALICANRFLFPRALVNLIQNSAQAMPQDRVPQIWLRVSSAEREHRLVFTVEDNGSGIDEAQLQSIWDRGTSGRQSSGLGLAFVRNVVEQMHGEIHIQSHPGQGTRICLEFSEEPAES